MCCQCLHISNFSFILDYPVFLQKLKSYFDSSDKKYYVTAAPQCVYPDANLDSTMNQFPMDAIFVQFCKFFFFQFTFHFMCLLLFHDHKPKIPLNPYRFLFFFFLVSFALMSCGFVLILHDQFYY